MGVEEEVIGAAEDILKQVPGGLTKEALVRMIVPRLPNKLLPARIIEMLRKQPQRFVEGGDGRWRLRAQATLLSLDEPVVAPITNSNASPAQNLRQGCYIVFELEAIGVGAPSPASRTFPISAMPLSWC